MVYERKTLDDLTNLAEKHQKPREVIFSAFSSLVNYKKRRFSRMFNTTINELFDTDIKKYFDYSKRLETQTIHDLDKRYTRMNNLKFYN